VILIWNLHMIYHKIVMVVFQHIKQGMAEEAKTGPQYNSSLFPNLVWTMLHLITSDCFLLFLYELFNIILMQTRRTNLGIQISVLMKYIIHIVVFWVMIPCSYLQDRTSTLKMETVCSSTALVPTRHTT
jgi:hypothetical protein